jgi:hypothetical protein
VVAVVVVVVVVAAAVEEGTYLAKRVLRRCQE